MNSLVAKGETSNHSSKDCSREMNILVAKGGDLKSLFLKSQSFA